MGREERKMNVYCSKCKRDVTYSMKFYDQKLKRYCYDCWEKKKQRNKKEKQSDNESVRQMYKRGLKPSEIALKLGCTVQQVYDELIGEKKSDKGGK
jgi:DNA invertase Pin-like site-specific DNA recombinase